MMDHPPETALTARLFCRVGEFLGRTHDFSGERMIGSGRENQIVLASPRISRRHARIYREGGAFWIEDLGSTNGTRLDGTTLDQAVPLDHLHVITFSDTIDFIFVMTEGEVAVPEVKRHPQLEAEPTAPNEARAERPSVPSVEESGPGTIAIDLEALGELPDLPVPPPDGGSGESGDESGPGTIAIDLEALGALPDLPVPPPDGGSSEVGDESGPGTIAIDLEVLGALPDLPAVPPSGDSEGDSSPGGTIQDVAALRSLPDLPAQAPARPPLPALRLAMKLPNGELTHFELKAGQNTLGRAAGCDVMITGDPRISRRHAVLDIREGLVVVRDLGGQNGTWIKGRRIVEEPLDPGGSFRLGPNVELVLESR